MIASRSCWVAMGLILVGGQLLFGAEPGEVSAVSDYFCYTEIFTQPGYRDSAGNPDPLSIDQDSMLEVIQKGSPTDTSEQMSEEYEMDGRIWDLRLLQAYVTLLSEINQEQALKLRDEQIAWSKVRAARVKEVREGKYAAWFDIEKAYNDSTRWRVSVLEERYRYPEGPWEYVREGAPDKILPPGKLIPSELVCDFDGDRARELARKGDGGFTVMKDFWDADLLLAYVRLMRTLPKDAALALAKEESEWEVERFHLWEDFNLDGSDAGWKKWDEGYTKMSRERIAELKRRLAAQGGGAN